MSYDQYLYKTPNDKGPVCTWDEDYLVSLGAIDEVQKLLETVLPGLRWHRIGECI